MDGGNAIGLLGKLPHPAMPLTYINDRRHPVCRDRNDGDIRGDLFLSGSLPAVICQRYEEGCGEFDGGWQVEDLTGFR